LAHSRVAIDELRQAFEPVGLAVVRGGDRNRTAVQCREKQLQATVNLLERYRWPDGLHRGGHPVARALRREARLEHQAAADHGHGPHYSVAATRSEIAATRSGSSVSGPTSAARQACSAGMPLAISRPADTSSRVPGPSANPCSLSRRTRRASST